MIFWVIGDGRAEISLKWSRPLLYASPFKICRSRNASRRTNWSRKKTFTRLWGQTSRKRPKCIFALAERSADVFSNAGCVESNTRKNKPFPQIKIAPHLLVFCTHFFIPERGWLWRSLSGTCQSVRPWPCYVPNWHLGRLQIASEVKNHKVKKRSSAKNVRRPQLKISQTTQKLANFFLNLVFVRWIPISWFINKQHQEMASSQYQQKYSAGKQDINPPS